MPDYLAPGAYVEETSFRAKSIEAAPTSTAAFVGPTAAGPLATALEPPRLLTSAWDFEQIYGGLEDLASDTGPSPNYLARAVRSFFEEGGRRLYVARTPNNPTFADYQAALDRLLEVEKVSTVAAPGASTLPDGAQTNAALIAHAETAGAYRFAVIDPPPGLDVGQVRELRAAYDSAHAALYYPWVIVADPLSIADPARPPEIALPPSGAICGIYARSDTERAVFKAPANEVVRSAVNLEKSVTFGEQEVLNPLGINCIRKLPNRGIRVWGARTLSSDPETKYVNISRYRDYLEASLAGGLAWVAFEPNNELLWANVRAVVQDFLTGEWRAGGLLGARPEEAFFVRCDRSTMTQADIDAGRLMVLVGMAAVKPAEFIVFRTRRLTADTP